MTKTAEVSLIKNTTAVDTWLDLLCDYQTSDERHTPRTENDLRMGAKFLFRRETQNSGVGYF